MAVCRRRGAGPCLRRDQSAREPGYYVAHDYTQSSARETVELTVTWQARFTVPGLSPLQLTDLPNTAQEIFAVVEARSRLVAG